MGISGIAEVRLSFSGVTSYLTVPRLSFSISWSVAFFTFSFTFSAKAPSLWERAGGEASPSSRRLVSPNARGGATRVAQLTPGQLIEHERFGVGEVIKVEGTGENTKALIRFKNAGEKQLLLKFARFRVLG